MQYQKEISKEAINELETFRFQGEVLLITDQEEARRLALILQQEKILGFDTETRPSFTKGESYSISLLQLATEKCAYLFRLNLFKSPPELIDILADKNIIKTGVAIRDDVKGLQKLFPFEPQNFIDLAELAKEKGFKNFGLRALTAIFLNKRLSKRAKVTNWENKRLTPPQIQYAACDAVSSLLIYLRLKEATSV